MSWVVYLLGGGLLVFADQMSKEVARQQGWAAINAGISYGLLPEYSKYLHLVGLLLLGGWWISSFRVSRTSAWPLTMIFFAGLSNFIDRVRWGGVTDWLPIPFLQLENNLADYAVVAGFIWLLLVLFYGKNHTT